jgi:BirA family transcriptional regulator, biotin operon repressor / biotin---[acetyl-CoA-carboxylase] ligase
MSSSLRFQHEHVASIDSTNAELLRRAAAQSVHLRSLSADVQTAGRGQRGRRWIASPGDALLMSVGYEFPASIRLEGLSLAIGVAAAHAAQRFASGRIGLKWPNDVLLDDRAKLAGVLIESVNGRGVCTAVIGIGVNIRPPATESLPFAMAEATLNAFPAAALLSGFHPRNADGAAIVRDALCTALLEQFALTLAEFAQHGFAAFRERWWTQRAFVERRVRIHRLDRPHDSQTMLCGMIEQIDDTGALILNDGRTLHTLRSGMISLRPV